MNKVSYAVALASVVATSAFAQNSGSQITFKNSNLGDASATPPVPIPYVLDSSNTRLVGANYVAQIFYTTSASSTSYEALGTPAPFRAAGSPLAGTWNPGVNSVLTIPDVTQGTPINVEVRVWDSSLFSSYAAAAAVAGGGATTLAPGTTFQFGETTPFAFTPPTDAQLLDPSSTYMKNFQGFSLTSYTVATPEPSMVALGALGVGALLWRRRK